ncbi:MAG TPA: YidC/Oxa1 family membrane protein insertase [Gemmatimonadaceae bacterium]
MLWSNVLDIIRGSLFVLAHSFGGSFGAAILIGSALARIALLPITLRAARRRVRQERTLAALAPQLERIRKRHAAEPSRFVAETRALHAAHGISPLDRRTLFEGLVTMPPAVALYTAIRGIAGKVGGFLWVADIAKPDRWLAALAATVAGAIAWLSASSPAGKGVAQLVPVAVTSIITVLVLLHLSSALALYTIANSVIAGAERQIALRTTDAR